MTKPKQKLLVAQGFAERCCGCGGVAAYHPGDTDRDTELIQTVTDDGWTCPKCGTVNRFEVEEDDFEFGLRD
jgi:hypothetical protein